MTKPDAVPDAGESYALVTRGGPICPGPRDRICGGGSAYTAWGPDFFEEPRYVDDYHSASGYERTFKVVNRLGMLLDVGGWLTRFEVESDRPSKGELDFAVLEPFAVPDEVIPDLVHLYGYGMTTDCIDWSGEPQGARLSLVILRDSAGALLVAGGMNPLRPDGSAVMAPNDELGITLRWKDAGCAPCAAAEAAGGLARRTVAIELTLAEDGIKRSMLPGEPQSFERDGIKYIFVVDNAELPVVKGQGSLCGGAQWTLYRDGMLVELNPDGTLKK